MKPKPVKPAAPSPSSPPKGSEPQSQGAENATPSPGQNGNASEAAGDVPPAAAEPMETDKPESSPNKA